MTPSAFGTQHVAGILLQRCKMICQAVSQLRTFRTGPWTLKVPQIPRYFRHPVVRNLVAEDVRDEFVKDFTQEEQKEDAKNLTCLSGIDSTGFQERKGIVIEMHPC